MERGLGSDFLNTLPGTEKGLESKKGVPQHTSCEERMLLLRENLIHTYFTAIKDVLKLYYDHENIK